MKNLCVYCKKTHDDWAWRYRQGGWYCTKFFTPSGAREDIPKETKEDRKKYFNSLVQPFRNGEVSKEYIEAYGAKGINVTPEEAKKAKYTWKDVDGWSTREKSK